MADELDYKSAVEYIGTQDASQARQSTTVDINGVLASKLDIRSLTTADINGMLDRLDLRRVETSARTTVLPRMQEPALQQVEQFGRKGENMAKAIGGMVKSLGKGIEEIKIQPAAQPKAQEPAATSPEAAQTAPEGYRPMDEERRKAAKGLGGIVKSIGKEFEQAVSRKTEQAGAEALMMPKLSLSDQIHDLKMIDEGLDQGIFDPDYLEVINAEISNLYSVVISEKPEGTDPDQTELRRIRDSLCKSAYNKLNFGIGPGAA